MKCKGYNTQFIYPSMAEFDYSLQLYLEEPFSQGLVFKTLNFLLDNGIETNSKKEKQDAFLVCKLPKSNVKTFEFPSDFDIKNGFLSKKFLEFVISKINEYGLTSFSINNLVNRDMRLKHEHYKLEFYMVNDFRNKHSEGKLLSIIFSDEFLLSRLYADKLNIKDETDFWLNLAISSYIEFQPIRAHLLGSWFNNPIEKEPLSEVDLFSPPEIERIGRDVITMIPSIEQKILPDGGLMLINTENIFHWGGSDNMLVVLEYFNNTQKISKHHI